MKGKCILNQEFEFYKLTKENFNDFLKIRLSDYIDTYGDFIINEFDDGFNVEFYGYPCGFEYRFGYFYVNNFFDEWEEYSPEEFKEAYNIVEET